MSLRNDGVDQGYLYEDSAYVQNMAEICYTILHDMRWTVPKSSSDAGGSEFMRLFSSEYGDNMNAILAFEKLLKIQDVNSEPRSFLMKNYSAKIHPSSQGTESGLKTPASSFGRCMHLYARMFHRKGPWFTIDDLFFRYYFKKRNCNSDEGLSIPQDFSNSDTISSIRYFIDCFFLDLQYLLRMGIIRSVESEEECASMMAGSGILTQKDVTKLRQKMGIKESSKSYQAPKQKQQHSILKFIKGQTTLSFHSVKEAVTSSCKASSSQFIPIIQHLDNLITSKFCEKLSSFFSKSDDDDDDDGKPSAKENDHRDVFQGPSLKKIWEELLIQKKDYSIDEEAGPAMDRVSLVSCIRLKEEPLLTLRRAARLILCAGSGPGANRWDGTNAWISVDGNSNGNNIRSPCSSQWYNVEFPGLKYRLGLQDYHFFNCYRPHLLQDREAREIFNDVQVFNSYQSFKAWEWSVEVRCWIDFLLENKGCNAGGTLPKKFFLSTKENREEFITSFLGILDPLSEKENFGDRILSQAEASYASIANSFQEDSTVNIICSIAIVCTSILLSRLQTIEKKEIMSLLNRPWLRHMRWESVLAYVLWNCVDIFEKERRWYVGAIWTLEIILFGHSTIFLQEKLKTNDESRKDRSVSTLGFVQFLLSRRVRGKAFDRLQIDRGHFYGKATIQSRSIAENSINMKNLGCCASIPFSYVRKLAKRMKFPLTGAFRDIFNIEVMELGIRLSPEASVSSSPLRSKDDDGKSSDKSPSFVLPDEFIHLPAVGNRNKRVKYDNWSPVTDVCVANSLNQNSEKKLRKRCSYIGREDSGIHDNSRSLTVEELAMEEYFLGIPPTCLSSNCGLGWKGWHDEGGFLRLLFRLLCTDSILAGDPEGSVSEEATIYLVPYQSSPFDLHVAHCFYYTDPGSEQASPARSFYERRKEYIEVFLNYIENLSPQQLSDMVYESVERNAYRSHPLSIAASSIRRMVRTCSAIAAGLGGRTLASIFRSLCFDFRHYNAGLPDLLLIRASYPCGSTFVELGEWIGEGFMQESTSLRLILESINDDGLLGCSDKDFNKASLRGSSKNVPIDQMSTIDKLQLTHDGKDVVVECMLVEVKSANDTLDERQEDWLNIIDRVLPSRARVCKFTHS